MTPRTFFTIVLKVVGLFLLKDFVLVLPQLIGLGYIAREDRPNEFLLQLTPLLIVLGLLAVLIFMCFFRTGVIIDRLALDKHFTQDFFQINIHRSTVIQIAIIFLGGFMIVNSIPEISEAAYYHLYQSRFGIPSNYAGVGRLIFYSVQLLVGFALVANSRLFLTVIERLRRV